jgi:hypothetical protein
MDIFEFELWHIIFDNKEQFFINFDQKIRFDTAANLASVDFGFEHQETVGRWSGFALGPNFE